MFTHAIARKPGRNFSGGLTSSDLGKPDFKTIIKQHETYVNTLKTLGLNVEVLDSLEDFPDAYFVEDTAVITPDAAVITNPGADARKGEIKSIEPVLAGYREIYHIQAPGTLDGGDVLMIGTHFYIGISERTNRQGAEQLGRILEKFGNTWTPVPVGKGLHLKSGVTYAGNNTLVLTPGFAQIKDFDRFDKVVTGINETHAANSLLVNGSLLMPDGFPVLRDKLEKVCDKIIELDMSEVQKMDGGLTCMSLRF